MKIKQWNEEQGYARYRIYNYPVYLVSSRIMTVIRPDSR